MDDHRVTQSFRDSPNWWGPRWIGRSSGVWHEARRDLSVLDLIDAGTLDPWVAAFLWELIACRSSIIVIAGPSGVGKTTLLTALADFLPPGERLVLVRGAFDPLDFLDDRGADPQATTAMVNEISPHLPIYLWGPGVRRLLSSQRRFRIFATAHATSAQDLVAQLAGYPLRVPLAGIARLGAVIRLEARIDAGIVRRAVTEVTAFDVSHHDGIVLRPFLNPGENSLDHGAARAWFDDEPGRGNGSSLRTRHNILTSKDMLRGATDPSDHALRRVFAAAFARAAGAT